jgi:hypothetical protein
MNNDPVETTLEQVDSQRRGFLRELLAGGAAVAALPVMTTVALGAPEDQQGAGKGKGGGKGGGKGKGDGKGKGEGGKGKGEGGMPDPARMAAMMIRNFDKDGDKALNEKELVAALTEMAKRRAAGKGKGDGKGKGQGGKGKGEGKGKGQGGKGKAAE